MNEFKQISDIVYGFAQKGKDDLGRDIQYIKNEHFSDMVNEIEKLIKPQRFNYDPSKEPTIKGFH